MTAERENIAPGVPSFQIEGQRVGTDAALLAFGAAVHDVFGLEQVDPMASSRPIDVEAWHLGTIMLGVFSGPALFFDRPPGLVAKSGLDHILVQLYTEGGFSGMAGSGPITVSAGDICVFDLTDTFSTRSTAFSNCSLLIPRDAISPALDDLEPLHGMVIPSSEPLAGFLAEYLLSLVRRMPSLGERDALLAAQATVSLTSMILAGEARRGARQNSSGGHRSPLRLVSDYIDGNIQDPDLDAERITRALGISRASLYRLFATSGGVGRHIRRRRLSGAALELSHLTRRPRISEIATRWGFVNDASFSRAFRQAFGIAPRAVRERNLAFLDAGEGAENSAISEHGFAHWMRTLRTGRGA